MNGTPKSKGFGPPQSDSDSDDDHYTDGTHSEESESEDDAPAEVPDDELDDAAKLARAAERKEQGNDFFKKKDYLNATRLYSQAIALDPKNPAYFTNRAASRMGSRQYPAALDDCLAAAALQAGAPQSKTLLRLARCQLALGRVEPAQQTLDQLLKLDGANPQVQQERARCARIANHVANVKRELVNKNWSMVLLGVDAAAREVDETPKEWRTWKVEALIGKKQYDAAAGMAADLLRSDPNQPEPLYYRGLCLYLSGNHPQAIAHCQSALRNDPDFTLARTLLKKVKLLDSLKDAGNDAFKRQAWQEAADKYSEGLEVDAENETYRATLLNNRATAWLKMKKYDDALADCDACLELNSSYFKALRTRARVHLANEDWEAAVRDFKAAYELAPAGSNDESGLKKEVQEAEGALKRSKLKDYYAVLSVAKDASEVEIKKAYRKMSLIHHPDKGGSDDKFKEIGEAYAILSDPQRRRKFDMGIDENDPHGGMGGGGDPFGGGVDINDLFGGGGGFSFGGGGGGGFGGGGGRRGGNPYGF